MAENYRKSVFCEIQFLKECLSQINTNEYDNTHSSKLRFWNSIENLLFCQNIKLFLDISDDEFNTEIKNIEKRKLKAARKGENSQLDKFEELLWRLNYEQLESNIHLKCCGEKDSSKDFLDSIETNLNAFYLTCKDTDTCEDFSRRYGISILTSKKMTVDWQQFEDTGCAIGKKERTNWGNIMQGKYNTCNALILIDNYILKDTDFLDENLREILQTLLPETLANNTSFHLSIFTEDMKLKSADRFEKLNTMVKELRPNLSCEISLFKTKGFHDRTIITNNLYISCGAGFYLLKKGAPINMTVVNILNPYLTDTIHWAKKAYSNLVNAIKYIINNKNEYKSDSFPEFYLGAGINRLIE